MTILSAAQIEDYRRDGYLVVEGAIGGPMLAALRDTVDGWADEAARSGQSWGRTKDGRDRFDVVAPPSEAPVLRRVNNPVEVSDDFRKLAFDSNVTDMVAALIGPDVKFHHSKINLKPPGSPVAVKMHQDFPYTPHSNPDLVSVLIMLDDTDEENGGPSVAPASQREGVYSLWQDGRFTGAVSAEVIAANRERMVPVAGKAGAICLLNTLTLHESGPNRSGRSRRLFIPVYSAADAVPLAPSPVPSEFEGRIVRGNATGRVRLEPMEFELPENYTESSFFAVQARQDS